MSTNKNAQKFPQLQLSTSKCYVIIHYRIVGKTIKKGYDYEKEPNNI